MKHKIYLFAALIVLAVPQGVMAQYSGWSQQTACPGWNNPNNFNGWISMTYGAGGYSGSGGVKSGNSCPNVMTGDLGLQSIGPNYTAAQMNTLTADGCSYQALSIPNQFKPFAIMTDLTGTDPNTANHLKYVPTQFNTFDTTGNLINTNITRSIRIGDGAAGCSPNTIDVSILNYDMRVTPYNALLYLYYAIVAQSPTHGMSGNPAFIVRLMKKNSRGEWVQINDTLAYYISVTLASNTYNPCPNLSYITEEPSFNNNGWHQITVSGISTGSTIVYKDWQKAVINLSNYLYDTIRVQALIHDCSARYHFAYAYIAGECRPMSINVSGCDNGGTTALSAPNGFINYEWQASEWGVSENLVDLNPGGANSHFTFRTVANGSSNIYHPQLSDFNIIQYRQDGTPVDSVGERQTFKCRMTTALDPNKPYQSNIYVNATRPFSIQTVECTTGQNLVYSLSCSSDTASVIGYEGDCSGHLEIPSSITVNNQSYTVTRIEEDAFGGDSSLTSVSLPSTLTYIGRNAFSECTSLTNVYLNSWNSNLDTIDDFAFWRCYELSSFGFSYCPKLKYIGSSAFGFCNLSEVRIVSNIQNIAKVSGTCTYGLTMNPFRFNPSLSVLTIGYSNKYYSSNNTIIDMESQEVVAAGINATVPSGVTSIADAAFSNTNVRKFIIPEGVTTLGYGIIYVGSVDSLFLPSTLTTSCLSTIMACKTLKYIEYAEGIQSIPNMDAGYAASIPPDTHLVKTVPKEVVLPSTVTTINHFEFNEGLERIVCKAVVPPTFSSGNYDINSWQYDDSLITVIVPCQSVEAYRNADTWRRYNIVGDSCQTSTTHTVTVTTNDATMGTVSGGGTYNDGDTATMTATANDCHTFVRWSDGNTNNPREIVVTQDTTLIAEFEPITEYTAIAPSGQTLRYTINCANSTATVSGFDGTCVGTLIIPDNIIIGNNAFAVTEIGQYAFLDCTGLTNVVIPNTVTHILSGAFGRCTNLTSVDIPNSVISIGEYTFIDGYGTGLTVVQMGAFYGCTSITSVSIPSSVTLIGSSTFWGCSNLTSVTIPSSTDTIGYLAFRDCENLRSVTSLATIPPFQPASDAFRGVPDDCILYIPCESRAAYQAAGGWSNFTNIHCLDSQSVTTDTVDIRTCTGQTLRFEMNNRTHTATVIGYVGQCEGGLTVPAWFSVDDVRYTVTAIGPRAFQNCTGLTEVTLPVTITLVDQEAFKGCSGLLKVDMK